MSKSIAIQLINQIARTDRTIERLQGERKELIRMRDEECSDKCWCCPHSGITTDLSPCEVKNVNYPERCAEMGGAA